MGGLPAGQELKDIESTLIQVCAAIVSVLRVDVTIVDAEYRRVVGTGRYAGSTGSVLSGKGVFERSMSLGASRVVEDPRENDGCETCENKQGCEEFAQVCCPIVADGETVGIMGLAAFDEAQKEVLLSNKEGMLDFIESMAGLIASKINENREIRQVRLMAGELESLLDSMDEGVVTLDSDGTILRYNRIADEMLGLAASLTGSKKATNVLAIASLGGRISVEAIRSHGGRVSNEEFSFLGSRGPSRCFWDAKPISLDDNVQGYLLTFIPASEMLETVNAVSGGRQRSGFDEILGSSPSILQAKESARRIARGSSTVLIQGESGTGKELFARAIHDASGRRDAPFVALNCSAIPESLMESELFGYEEGAFTGARKGGRMGKFELAGNGTIFLDEIGDMPLNLQTKLLRVLQENAVERVGGNALIPVGARVLAASNKDLERMVAEREFRKDLFYRLNVIPLSLPPLRERTDDIVPMAGAFLEKYNRKLGRRIRSIRHEVSELFLGYDWPGNVRELENTLEFAVNMCAGEEISIGDLPRRVKEARGRTDGSAYPTLDMLERNAIADSLRLFGSPEKAATALGIGRATIYRKMKQFGL